MIHQILPLILLSFSVYSVGAQCRQQSHKYIGDLCYILPNDKLTFQDARNSCHQTSTQLAVIHTTTQSNILATLVKKQSSSDLFWIGLSRQSVSSRFQWDDGTDMYFSNFDPNMPKNDLYVAESTANGKWRTLDGHDQLPFVCSYDPNTVPTPEPIDSSCTPQSNHTVLFAYSNDLDPQVVQDSAYQFAGLAAYGNYTKFGSIRFDTKNAGSFHYSDQLFSLDRIVDSNLPDPSLGFSNNQTGSDILDVLQRFLQNSDGVPVCGSQIFILLKRHPLKMNTSQLLSQLQQNHVFIYTSMSNSPILGENYKTMYNLSGLTSGMASFVNDSMMYHNVFYFGSVFSHSFPVYSINPIAKSGIERNDLAILRNPPSDSTLCVLSIEIAVQDHGPLDKFRSFNLTLTNTVNSTDQVKWNSYQNNFGFTFEQPHFPVKSNTNYSVKFVAHYSDDVPENLQIRMRRAYYDPIDYWLPFTDWN